jgi:hypothetical protein
MFTNALVVVLGIICMWAALGATKIRGGIFSHRPDVPISKAGRAILFVGGLLILVDGIRRFL